MLPLNRSLLLLLVLITIPSLKLAKYYYSKKNVPAAAKWRDKALLVSKRANDEDLIKKVEELKW